jgi:hexosaminidase
MIKNMKKILLFLISLISIISSCIAQNVPYDNVVHIVPEPVSVKVEQGYFQLNESTTIISTNEQTSDVANMMATLLNTPSGYHLTVNKGKTGKQQKNVIILKLNTNTQLGDEGYTMQVSRERILIVANKPNGLFYGMQTLMQLLPPEIESHIAIKPVKWDIPCVNILDYPRFGWRGLMLDVSRHFFSKEFIERYLDEMVKYKFNVFHWHLTDDNGWRIQIKGLPKLTEVGAWRVPRIGSWNTFDPGHPGEKTTDGGYYTQEDIREVVAYAKKRFITILPEIDVPGHSLALNASYPNLSCTRLQYSVDPGTRYFRHDDNSLCVANDSTWLILDKIFTQVAELFPGEYIHVGGDEVHAEYWENDPKDQALMKREGISTLEGLQSYFEKKLEKIITSKGKKMIGWYEMDDQFTSEAALMSWKKMSTAVEAIKMGHHVVMATSDYGYMNYTFAERNLSHFYEFEPVPEGADQKYILGAQGCLWTELVPNERQVEYMTWPRAMALSEVFWSPKSVRNLNDFLSRMQYRLKYLDVAQVNYSCPFYDPIITGVKSDGLCHECDDSVKVKIDAEIPDLDIYYTFDGTNPDNFYPRYEGKPVGIPKGATEINVITYQNGKPVGHQINCQLIDLDYKNR